MGKHATNRARNQEKHTSGQRTLWLTRFVQRSLYDFVISEGMKALDTLLEVERTELCGPAFGKGQPVDAMRWGHTDGRLVMGGRRVVVRRPRVRQNGTEVPLPSWQEFADEDPLEKRTVE